MLERDKLIINFIENLEKGKEDYKFTFIDENSLDASGVYINSNFKKNHNNNYEITFKASDSELENKLNPDYFMSKPSYLVSSGKLITGIENYNVLSVTQGIQDELPNNYRIEVNAFRQGVEFKKWQDSRQKAYIKCNNEIFDPTNTAIQFDLNFNGSSTKNALHISIDKIDLIFYYEQVDKEHGYFVFDANALINFEKFKTIIEIVSTAYGLITGYYLLGSIYYFSLKQESNRTSPLSYYYENISQILKSDNAILKNGFYEDIPKNRITLSSSQFNNLVKKLYADNELYRSAKLLITAFNEKGCAKASLAAVALETITKRIDTESVTGKIIDDKKIAHGLRNKLKKVIKEYKESINPQQSELLVKKVDNINTNTNFNKLEEAFKSLNIKLKPEEVECIKSRNLFLHGNQPKNIKNIKHLRQDEIVNIMSNRLVMLSCMLLLKLSKFDGFVIDWGMTEVIKWRMLRSGEKPPNGCFLRDISQQIFDE